MSWAYRPQLDGMRCLAVYVVLLFHAGVSQAGGGYIGVDLFFVLSGFLVTNVILNEIDAEGRFSVGSFYARRVRRLLPGAVLAIAATCVVQVLLVSEPDRLSMVRDAQAALLYVANWQFIADANDYFGSEASSSPFLHFWSLSIEEQYYIVYPLLVLLVLGRLRWSQRRLATVLSVLVVASVVAQVLASRVDENYAYYATQTRIYQPLVGCVLAIALRGLTSRVDNHGHASAGHARAAALAAVAGLLGVLLLCSDLLDIDRSLRGLLATVASAAAIGGVVLADRALVSRALSLSWPRYLGQISYGTYLWHWPVLLALTAVLTVAPLMLAVLGAVVATALAALSAQLLENPIRRSRPLGRVPWRVVAGGLAVSVVAAVVVVPTVLESSRQPAIAAASGSGKLPASVGDELHQLNKPVPDDIDFAALKADNGEVGPQCSDGTPESCVVVDEGTGPLVLLVGDSHAGMLAPALHRLAEDRGFRLSTDIMNNCPWQRGLSFGKADPSVQEACAAMREELYDTILPAMKPDLVILASNVRTTPGWEAQAQADDAAEHPRETYDQMMLRKARDTVAEIAATGARVNITHTTFGTNGYDLGGFDPLDCLARADQQADCAVVPPRTAPSVDAGYAEMAVTMDGVYTSDLGPAYCPGVVLCAPIVEGEVVWHDLNHLSSAFVIAARDAIWTQLTASGSMKGLQP
ncbi:acyltransferase family protein [Nocardioides caricicola]|uniref:Acyltransferase family protein n=1 Tax=Nocardioides caricicola TaxID=634770 RepID=A0ABW0MZY3_9ACTN